MGEEVVRSAGLVADEEGVEEVELVAVDVGRVLNGVDDRGWGTPA